MIFFLNVIFGLLAGYLTDYLLARGRVSVPIRTIVAILVGFIVYFANLAVQVVQ